MATNKNITMKQFNGTDYDTLYPKTKVEQVEGAYTQQQILSNSTKGLFWLGNDAVPDDVFKMLGGLRAVIYVFTEVGTRVSITKGGKTFTATADSEGLAYLYPSEFGVWTVTAGSTSKTINIDANAVFYLVMSNLESIGWSQVAVISKKGLASAMFHIGDKKNITVNGVTYAARIIGFDHDTLTTADGSRTNAGITFQLVDCLEATYFMNRSNTNVNGWRGSTMRTSTMATLLNQLPSDLKSVLKFVNKVTGVGNNSSGLETTSDKLFLLSEIEVFGATKYAYDGEGKQYEYYTSGNSTIKKVDGSAYDWWERSPIRGNTSYFCNVGSGGNTNDSAASASFGVSFAFCV